MVRLDELREAVEDSGFDVLEASQKTMSWGSCTATGAMASRLRMRQCVLGGMRLARSINVCAATTGLFHLTCTDEALSVGMWGQAQPPCSSTEGQVGANWRCREVLPPAEDSLRWMVVAQGLRC